MNIFAKTAFSDALGSSLAKFGGQNPLFRSGLYALGVRIAMRSFPVTLAALGAGAAYRYWKKNKTAKRPAGAKRTRAKPARAAKHDSEPAVNAA